MPLTLLSHNNYPCGNLNFETKEPIQLDNDHWVTTADVPDQWCNDDNSVTPLAATLFTMKPYIVLCENGAYVTLRSVVHILQQAGLMPSVMNDFVDTFKRLERKPINGFMTAGRKSITDHSYNLAYGLSSSSEEDSDEGSDHDHSRGQRTSEQKVQFIDSNKPFVRLDKHQQQAIMAQLNDLYLVASHSNDGLIHGWSFIGQVLFDMAAKMTDQEFAIAKSTFAYMTKSLCLNDLTMYKAIQMHVSQTIYTSTLPRFGVMDGQMHWLKRKIDKLQNQLDQRPPVSKRAKY